MTWREELRAPSFRGVPFLVESTDAELGRRLEIIRYPGREETTAQDLGKDSAEFSVQAYVIGPDYTAARRALEAALLTPGPGQLVLPTRGELFVHITGKSKFHEEDGKGGMASVAFSCVAAVPQTAFAQAYAPGALRAICDNLIDESAARAANIDTAGLSAGTVASQVSLVERMSEAMSVATGTIASIVSNVASVKTTTTRLTSQAEALLATPETVATMLGQAFESLFMDAADLVSDGASILSRDFDAATIGLRKKIITTTKRALAQILDVSFRTDLDTSTPNRERETTNLRALSSLYRMQAVGAFARAVPDLPWSSSQEALAARDFFLAVLDGIEGEVDDDDYEALRDLRVAVSRYLSSVALKLPVLRAFQTRAETCALLIAYELYGDARRESELVARNNMANPANVTPMLVLEVSNV